MPPTPPTGDAAPCGPARPPVVTTVGALRLLRPAAPTTPSSEARAHSAWVLRQVVKHFDADICPPDIRAQLLDVAAWLEGEA